MNISAYRNLLLFMDMQSEGYSKTIFRYDLDAYGISVKDRDFKEANIFANRIMSNSALFDVKEYGLIGYVLKEIANDGMIMTQRKDEQALQEYSEKSSKIISNIIKMLEAGQINQDSLWTSYSEQQNSTHNMFMSKQEKTAYVKLNERFSHEVIQNLMKIMENNKETLLYPRNELIRGILNEVGRISKVHGLTASDERFSALLRMLQRIDEYVKGTSIGTNFIKRSTNEILPLVEETISVFHLTVNGNEKGVNIDNLLWKMIKIWRYYFLKFMEVGQPFTVREEVVAEDPDEEKLIDEVTKYIEKDLGVQR